MPPPFAAVWFDCDSTLSAIEGVDELLQFVSPELRRDLAALTTQAMNGTLPLATVYVQRLASIAPRVKKYSSGFQIVKPRCVRRRW